MAGISLLNSNEERCIDLPMDIIQELSCYMMYRERCTTTFDLLVGQIKNYLTNHPICKKWNAADKEKFLMFAPVLIFNRNVNIEWQ